MAFTKDRVENHSKPIRPERWQEIGPYKPNDNLADTWPEVFIKNDANEIVFIDPREDLAAENPGESYWWSWLLAEAWIVNRQLAITLHGFRCMGTRLVKGEKSFVLRPEVSNRAWQSQEEYQKDRDKYLMPHRDQLAGLLKRLH